MQEKLASCSKAHLEDKLQQREGEPHVDVLVLVVPGLWQARVKAQEGEGAEDVLVKGLVIAVDVVGHLQHTATQASTMIKHVTMAMAGLPYHNLTGATVVYHTACAASKFQSVSSIVHST